jgi:hypothetical protein
MKMESVRSLKQELRERVLHPLVNRDLDRRRLGVRAMRQEKYVRPKTLALGVSTVNARASEYQLAVRVQHPLLWDSPEMQSICKEARNEVDVRFVGFVHPLQAPWYQERCSPVRIGCSVGHYEVTAGTLGAFVKDRQTGKLQILSNNHVLAAENQGKIGDDILQPGKYDNGVNPKDAIARLTRFVPIDFSGANSVDGAISDLTDTSQFDARSLDRRGKLAGGGTAPLTYAEKVYKVGRTTGLTEGVVTAVEVDNISVTYDQSTATFDSQIEVRSTGNNSFAAGGDSGSLVFDERNLAIGLIFGGTLQEGSGSSGLVYVNPLDTVLNDLNVDLLW